VAQVKISQLNPLTTQKDTDQYEVSDEGNGSYYETRSQQAQYYGNLFPYRILPSTNNSIVIIDGTSGDIKESQASVDDDGNIITNAGVQSDQLDTNIANVNGVLNLVDYNASMIYVSNSGLDSNNGQIVQPYKTIDHALGAFSGGEQINVSAGTYSISSAALISPGIYLRGQSNLNTEYDSTSTIGIDKSLWASTTAPSLIISDLALKAIGGMDFSATALVLNSSQQYLRNNNLSSVTLGQIQNVTIIDCQYTSLSVSDCSTFTMKNSIATSPITITTNSVNNGVYTFENVDFNNQIVTINNFGGNTPVINFINCINNYQVTYNDDGISGFPATIYSDLTSWATNGFFDNTLGALILDETTSFANYNTKNGIGNLFPGNNFFWDPTNYIFAAGYNAHKVAGTDQILLGRATSSKSNVFVAAESTGADFFTQLDNQFAVRYLNGYGFGTGAPAANFHVKAGNTGGMLFSANAAVTPTLISAGELNPTITATSLIFNGKYTGGGSFSYDLSNYTGDVTKAGNNNFTGVNTFNNYTLEPTAAVTLTGNTGTITAAQLASKNIFFTSVGTSAATWAFPTAANIDTLLGTPVVGIGLKDITITNSTNQILILATNSGVDFNGLSTPGSLILGPNSSVTIDLNKTGTAAYSCFGSGGVGAVQDTISILIDSPGNFSYPMTCFQTTGQLISITTIANSGTCTATFSLNSTPLTATPNSVSTTKDTQAVTGGNFTTGDLLNLAITSNSSCARMSVTISYYKNVFT
jgi:hypothetical protein